MNKKYFNELQTWQLIPRSGMIGSEDKLELTRYNKGWSGLYVNQYSPWELKKFRKFFRYIKHNSSKVWVRDEYREDENSDLYGFHPTVGRAVWFENSTHAEQFKQLISGLPERSLIYAFDIEVRVNLSALVDNDVNHVLLVGEENNILCMEDRRDLLAIIKLASV